MAGSESEGAITYTIDANDALGNAAAESTGGGVVFDKTPPTVSSSSAASGPALTYSASETPAKLYYWAYDCSYDTAVTNSYTIWSASSVTSPVNLSSHLGVQATFGFCIADAAGNRSTSYTFVWGTSSYGSATSRSLSISSRIRSALFSAHPTPASPLPIVPISFVDPIRTSRTETASDVTATAKDLNPIEVSYTASARASATDASGLSLLQRSATAATKAAGKAASSSAASATKVRYTQSSGSETRAAETRGTEANAGTRSLQPVSSAATASSLASRASASAPATEPQPQPKAPSAPTRTGMPGMDIYVNQAGARREESSEASEDGNESDIL
jgi:hypothetical protein